MAKGSSNRYLFAAATVAAAFAISLPSIAQEEESEPAAEAEVIEEIVAIGRTRPGDPTDHEISYDDQLRMRVTKDLQNLKLEQGRQDAWRDYDPMVYESSPRISWGYDAEAEARIRRDSDLMDVQYETTKPASLFRVGF
jgi:hypothetical protein